MQGSEANVSAAAPAVFGDVEAAAAGAGDVGDVGFPGVAAWVGVALTGAAAGFDGAGLAAGAAAAGAFTAGAGVFGDGGEVWADALAAATRPANAAATGPR